MTLVKTAGGGGAARGGDATQTIGEFCKLWQLASADVAILKTASLNDIQLQNLVSLYPSFLFLISLIVLFCHLFFSNFSFMLDLSKFL